MKKIVLLNIYLLLFWILGLSFSAFQYPIFSYLKSFSALLIAFPLLGINLTAIIQIYHAENFSKMELLSISSIFALIIAPLLISLEYEFFGIVSPFLPFLNSAISFFVLLFLFRKNKTVDFSNFNFSNLFKLKNQKNSNVLKSTFFWAFLVNLFAIVITFSAFDALPELDPHYWHSVFLEKASQNVLMNLSEYRPLFVSLIYIFNQSANVDLFALFKYVLPLFTLLIMIPAYLAIEKEKSKLKQFSILLTPFVTASMFSYLQIPIPQAVFNIILFYFLFSLIHSQTSQRSFFYFLGGFTVLLSYFYHESAILIFIIWLTVTAVVYFRKIFSLVKNNLLSAFLLFLMLFLNFSKVATNQFNFLMQYISKLFSPGNFNFLFPAQYINVDGNAVGWGGIIGVAKYYTYYTGPVLFLISIFLIYLIFSNSEFRKFIANETRKKESIAILLSLALFFSISEILPRFFGLALLPERAWMFSGIFSLVFIFHIFKFNRGKIFPILLILAFFVNLGGALYINDLKKYMITKNQLVSAEWIKQRLPENRIIFSNGNKNLIQLYSSSKYMPVANAFYFDEDSYHAKMNEFKNKKINLPENYRDLTESIKKTTSQLSERDPRSEQEAISHLLQKNILDSQELLDLLIPNKIQTPKDDIIYIYYAKPDNKNPYLNRPYVKSPEKISDFIFDEHPDKFKKIYTDPENNIMIWQIL